VRRALTMAIDRDKIIGDVLTSEATGEAYGRPAVSTVTPTLCDAHNDDIAPLPYDPTAARAALAALGWEDSDGDGVLDKDGRSFSFTLATTAGVPRRSDAMVIIQSNLKQIGVEVKLETLEFNTFFERLRKKDYDASLAGARRCLWT
jgi:peptide/nickel transport system substrate-binding protein